MNIIKISLLSFFLFIFQTYAFAAQVASPYGYWKTVDDKTGKVKSVVSISGSPSYLSATVVKLYPGALTVCSACSGNLKNKPILGMTVMYGLKQNPKNLYEWSGGSIFDPKTGKLYNCMLTVSPDGKTMVVRGYVGVSLFGRSQTWIRTSK
jgi:uncharacterized protein (DUF2147 family)